MLMSIPGPRLSLLITSAWAWFLCGCATPQGFKFGADSTLSEKRIGVYYDRKIIGTFEGLDDHDSRQYLTALAAALKRFSENVEFADMTGLGARITGYRIFPVKTARLFKDTVIVEYLVPGPGALGKYEDSLDLVMVFQNITTTERVATETETRFLPPFPGSPLSQRGFPIEHVVESENQQVSHLGYILWDFRKELALAHDGNSMRKQKFMDNGTTFSQDAEITSQRLLKELKAVSKRRP
jgi:hypothetical protein